MIHPAEPRDREPDPFWDQGTPAMARECIGNRGQSCPHCVIPLTCLNDYIGGGSHYWHLRCDQCEREYSFDTYRFKLEPVL